MIFPLVYVAFIYIRTWILNFDPEVPFIYPYYFLDLETQGIAGVIKWVLILMAGFVVTGYILLGIDCLCKNKNKKHN